MQDFKTQYERHLDLLRSHAATYDEGKEHFAYDVATKLRVFVHDTVDKRGRPKSVSLLTHLGVKNQLGFTDWALPETPPDAIVYGFGLCTIEMKTDHDGGTVSYLPACRGEMDPARRNPPTSFVDWWRLPVLERPLSFTRAEFVLFVANQEGAHVDAQLNEKYAAITRHNALGFTTGDGEAPEHDVALASVRHIAEELLNSLDNEIVWDGGQARVRHPTCPLPYSSEQARSVGRNDPCPCGSGRKQKKCFGLRRERNISTPPGRTRLWVPSRRPALDPTHFGPLKD